MKIRCSLKAGLVMQWATSLKTVLRACTWSPTLQTRGTTHNWNCGVVAELVHTLALKVAFVLFAAASSLWWTDNADPPDMYASTDAGLACMYRTKRISC